MNYLGTQEKVSLIQTLFDRGLLTRNEGREILNMSKIEGGDEFFIRKEYGTEDQVTSPDENEEGEEDVNSEG
jgi:hypothetical protein